MEDLPFYFVEIAPFDYESAEGTSGARLREAQAQSWTTIPHCGMVSTLDLGHPTFIHPTDKRSVGQRLAWWALARTYGRSGFGYASPRYRSMEISDNKIYIHVENAPERLCPMWTSLEGFEIAGDDRVFYPAQARIGKEVQTVIVSSPEVTHPVAVRYAFRDYVEGSLFNMAGLPASSFRSDDW